MLASTQMALGEIAKQLAVQAIGNAAKEPESPPRSSGTPAAADNLLATIIGQVQAMQKALKDDEELVVLVHTGVGVVRVLEFFVPSPHVVVVTGSDPERNTVRVVMPAHTLQLVCRAARAQPPARAVRINFVAPRAKPE